MRVTDGMKYNEVQRNLARLQSENADASRQASTGLRIGNPSDDPIGAAELARLSASLGTASAHRNTIKAVHGDAELAESTLAQASDLMTRAREIAMQGANDSLSADDRAALATEAKNLKSGMLQLANTRGTKGYLFAGSKTDKAAFDVNGLFQGDDVEQTVDVGGSTPTAVSASGAKAFTVAGGRDVFADLDALANALSTNDRTAIAATLDQVEASQKQITSERARNGLIVAKLDSTDSVLDQLGVDLGKREADVGAADPFEAYSRMTVLGQSLQRAVQVSRQVLDATNYWNS
ncbi:MAG TPA: flagellar hook-associated protein FlgL [Polyangiaceae bacterium]|nr:flagellar hook-associated protein FlgL [Polyangiaceae bacterium]